LQIKNVRSKLAEVWLAATETGFTKSAILYQPNIYIKKIKNFGIDNVDLTAINISYMITNKYLYRCVRKHEYPILQPFMILLIDYTNVEDILP